MTPTWTVAALAALLLAAGCASPSSPPPATTPPATAAPTTTPTTLPPTTPNTTTPTTPPPPPTLHVHVQCCRFDPTSANVTNGTEATWHDHQSGGHTVTIHRAGAEANQYVFDQSLPMGGTVAFTFQTAGTYHVFCRPHSGGAGGNYVDGMVSTIVVS